MGMRIDVVEGGKIAVRALRANRLRTLLTTVGIGIGVCTLLAIVGIIQGLNVSFAQQLSSLGVNSMYVTKFPWIIRGDFFRYRNRRELTPPLAEQLRELPEVAAVAPMVSKTDEVKFSSLNLANVRIQGTTADFPDRRRMGGHLRAVPQRARERQLQLGGGARRGRGGWAVPHREPGRSEHPASAAVRSGSSACSPARERSSVRTRTWRCRSR